MRHEAKRGMMKQAKFFGGSGQALQKKWVARKKTRVGIGQIAVGVRQSNQVDDEMIISPRTKQEQEDWTLQNPYRPKPTPMRKHPSLTKPAAPDSFRPTLQLHISSSQNLLNGQKQLAAAAHY